MTAFNDPTVPCCGRDAADCDCPPMCAEQFRATARQSDDDLKRALELVCDDCDAVLCDIEDGDGLWVLVGMVRDHVCLPVEDDPRCPACGQPIDYCQGHGDLGDPNGAAILALHDEGKHAQCHPDGCDDAHRWDRGTFDVIRTCLKCGERETYWDDESYPYNTCPGEPS